MVVSVLGPYISPFDPTATHPTETYLAPNAKYLFGTDHIGRDLLSRVLIGGRSTLLLGVGSTALAMTFGVPIGLLAGIKGGYIDEAIMRVMDVIMSFPTLLLALILLTSLPSNVWTAMLAVGVVFIPKISRVVRSSTLEVKNEEYVEAARVRGESDGYIMFYEVLPNIIPPIAVESTIRVGYAIIIGASLSFLGLGAQPPAPDWGYMIAQSQNHIWQTPWFLIWPALFLGLTIFSFNVLGDGLRDELDPKVTGDQV
ncbi:ABC transporter permease [Halonotius pteroides]|uniref:ABC transporter permease n=2 Tax=Halonotius pteroides TaxID=268735 RepID=A0A3A6QK54_9EURY|nr:ABC transporter permease [Halonotius pteroides]